MSKHSYANLHDSFQQLLLSFLEHFLYSRGFHEHPQAIRTQEISHRLLLFKDESGRRLSGRELACNDELTFLHEA